MKKWLSSLLAVTLVFTLAGNKPAKAEEEIPDFVLETEKDFSSMSMDDPEFLQYIEDTVYEGLEQEYLDNESTYAVEDVSVIYVSREYLEETAYNTKANIFFGYSLDQINEVFKGEKYVFTLSEKGDTVVQPFMEIPDDTYERIVKNVVIGTGIILVCVTISVLTAGAATPATLPAANASAAALAATSTVSTAAKVHMIFAASAKTAAALAPKVAAFAGTTTLVTRGMETGWDTDAMLQSAALNASEGFKWGALSGAVSGGAKEAFKIYRVGHGVPSPREAEQAALQKYGGREQVTYLNGEEVPYGRAGGTRADLVVGNEAIEVKRYSLSGGTNLSNLCRELTRQVKDRVENLPAGMTQRIVLDVEGRGYTARYVQRVVEWLQKKLEPVYNGIIPIDVVGKTL